MAQHNQLPALTLFIAAATNNVFTLNGDGKQKQPFMQECVIEGHLIAESCFHVALCMYASQADVHSLLQERSEYENYVIKKCVSITRIG